MKNCPYCAEKIQLEAKKCKHCGEWLDTHEKPIPHLEKKSTKPAEMTSNKLNEYFPKITEKHKEEKAEIMIVKEFRKWLYDVEPDYEEVKLKIKERMKEYNYLEESWQENYAIERIKKELGIEKEFGGWFIFYTYIRLPITFLSTIFFWFYNSYDNELYNVYLLITFVFTIILFYGLNKKIMWGYSLNKIWIIYDVVFFSFFSSLTTGLIFGFIQGIFYTLIWAWPIWIYFRNRKYIFN